MKKENILNYVHNVEHELYEHEFAKFRRRKRWLKEDKEFSKSKRRKDKVNLKKEFSSLEEYNG